MIFHLRQHSKEFKSFEEETELHEKETKKKNTAKKLATLELGIGSNSSSSSQKQYKYSLNGPMQSKFDEAVLKLLAVNCLPFSLVESPEWKALVELLDKKITVKNRKTYQRKMTKLADKVLTRVKRMIKKYCDVGCAITSDIWSPGHEMVLFLDMDNKFRLHHWTPVCEPMVERLTADVIQRHVDEMIEKLEVDGSVEKTCVSDNAASMLAGVRGSCCKSYGYNCHLWQLAMIPLMWCLA